jgi:hypothetical protein
VLEPEEVNCTGEISILMELTRREKREGKRERGIQKRERERE